MNSLKIAKLVPGGQGFATRADGKKGFFWNVLPGETVVEYEVTKEKSSYFEAIATKIENPSPHRISPKDPCYLSTSPWQILDYAYELAQKAELLLEQFRQFDIEIGGDTVFSGFASPAVDFAVGKIHVEPEFAPGGGCGVPTPSANPAQDCDDAEPLKTAGIAPDFCYRNKMEYALYFDHADAKIHLAFRHRGTHCKFPVEKSSIERPEIWRRAQEIVAELNEKHDEARRYQSLLLRCDKSGKVSGGLLENGKPHPVFPNLTDTLLGYEYSYSPNGFFQINLPIYELALKTIANHLGDSPKVLDLYAGVGTIGLSVARDRDLILVELNGAAYKELEHNCKNTSAKPILSASEAALDFIASDQTVIVDPPRAGLDDKLIARLLAVRPAKIIYLSCNPATQARDTQKLLEKYQITSCTPFNFFPRTPHLENLLIFESTPKTTPVS